MPDDITPAVEMTTSEALGVVNSILRTQYAGFKKLEDALKAALVADVHLTEVTVLIAQRQFELDSLDTTLAQKKTDVQTILDKLADQVKSAAQEARDTVEREIAAQRSATLEASALANTQLTELQAQIVTAQADLADLTAQVQSKTVSVMDIESRAESAEKRIADAKQSLVDAQAQF